MSIAIAGLHHVATATADPQTSLNFYHDVLGLRLVKQTIDLNNPSAHHLIFAFDATGSTPWLSVMERQNEAGAQVGIGQYAAVALSIPTTAFGFWIERLIARGIKHTHPTSRFGERLVSFADPDGLTIELVATTSVNATPGWAQGDIPEAHAIRSIHGLTLWESGSGRTRALFTEVLGFRHAGDQGNTTRLTVGAGQRHCVLDLVNAAGTWAGSAGVGGIEHVAWELDEPADLAAAREVLASAETYPEPIRNSVYTEVVGFEEPGGAIQQLATASPGLSVDEAPESLGRTLQLPPWMASMRLGIETGLPPLRVPGPPVDPALLWGAAEDEA